MFAIGTTVTISTPVGYAFNSLVLGRTECGPVRYLVRLTQNSAPFWVPASMASITVD